MSKIKMLLTKETTCIETVLYTKNIHPSMAVYNDEFYEELKESLAKEGLLRPLVVTPMTVREWRGLMEDNSEMLPPPNLPEDEVVLQIRCGNNRYWAAKEMDIKIITVTQMSLKEASKMCKAQQKEMAQWKEDGRWGN